jgi:6-phosphogluconolactonase
MSIDVRVSTDIHQLSARAAEAVATALTDAVQARGRCSLVLSGGSTPRTLYELLATELRDRIPWRDLLVFWGDERYVSHDDRLSNYRLAREALLDRVPCPAANVHPMPTHLADPDAAAMEYEATLRSRFDGEWPRFDVLLLGFGADGHTASLFPRSPALKERTRWVVAATAPANPTSRLTLTFPLLARAAHVHFLAAGADKAAVLARVLSGSADPESYPAAGVQRAGGTPTWWIDRAAAAQLSP